jgi:hypothetical protein
MPWPHWFVAFVLVASTTPALAHHSATATYDLSRTVVVQGTVTQFRFVNPHAMLSMDVPDQSGKIVKWTVELAGRLNLSEAGWNEHTVPIGQSVKVTGNPARVDIPRMFFISLVRPDGTELKTVGGDRVDEIEKARRERASQRSQSK